MKAFHDRFGESTEAIRLFFAPGRVNLIGEHTDYTGGYVLPAALHYGTWMAVRPRADRKFRLASTSFAEQVTVDSEHLAYDPGDTWANYPKGVMAYLQQKGAQLPGMDILFHGNIPHGAGLSSSASIELVTAKALCALSGFSMSAVEMVQLAQKVENQYVGVNCGIMDQFAVGMGKAEHAILLRCSTLEYQYIPLDLGDYRLVIVNSNKRRELTQSMYNERRQECEEGFRQLQIFLPHLTDLGSVTMREWEPVRKLVKPVTLAKRLEHIISENERVINSTQALRQGDLISFGQYMIQSHASLRNLFEVTGPELDVLNEEALQVDGCLAARMTGAGFGGCTVNLVHREAIQEFEQRVAKHYAAKTGRQADFYVCKIGDGVREVSGEDMACQF